MIDHCTLWPESLWGVYYGHCCLAHDIAYMVGTNRMIADQELAQCVASAGLPFTGFLMGLAVTWFGWLFYRKRNKPKS
jgi:hypothetical protein